MAGSRAGAGLRALATSLAAGVLLAAPGGARAQEANPLQTYRPTLVFDRDERHFPVPVDGRRHRAAEGPPRVYGHIARQGGDSWLQYWVFYAYNPQDRGVFRTGRHEGDWELFQLRLGPTGEPDLATLSQHHWAEGCAWRELRKAGPAGRRRPAVFVANGSHAVYSRPGEHDRPFPDPNDEADGRGARMRPPVERIDDRSPAWVRWPGRWGATEAGSVPGEAPSPPGPRFQDHRAWSSPATFHSERAVGCGSGPPRQPWQAAFLIAPLVLIGLAVLFRRRSGRRTGS